VNDEPTTLPDAVRAAQQAAELAGFTMSCDNRTGALLRTLVASKPDGRVLELGTGTGVGTAWLLAGMTGNAHLVTVEADPATAAIAREQHGGDRRVSLVVTDADTWLDTYDGPGFDLVFVDCRPGKFHRRDDLLGHLVPGGLYVGDDLLPQSTWPEDHQLRVEEFLSKIVVQPGLEVTLLNWASGLVLAARI
jgi:predicted O-methyltransferase YrrM